MTSSKRQILFGVLFCLAAVGLVMDRLFVLPQEAGAQENVEVEPIPLTLMLNVSDDLQVPSKTRKVAQRLASLCPSDRILEGKLRDAFTLPDPWLADVDPNGSLLGRVDQVAEFKSRYELLAVAGSRDSPSAFINHHQIRVGQTLHGFVLVGIDDRSATFEGDGLRFKLHLKSNTSGLKKNKEN